MTRRRSSKKKPLPPRVKRMTRDARLQSARHWLTSFEGKNVVRSYRKRYAVDLECALIELDILGVAIDPSHAQKLRASEKGRLENRRRAGDAKRAQQDAVLDPLFESDDHFAFIAGYTPGGFPFGVTWEDFEDPEPDEEPAVEQDE